VIEIRHLSWDSAFFALRVAQVVGGRLNAHNLPELEAWCQREQVDCLYFLADGPGPAAVAEAAGFRCTDERLTLERRLGPPPAVPQAHAVRPATPGDSPGLEDIAGEAHRGTRFFNDMRFPRERCVALYRTWIRNSVHGGADQVWVCEDAAGLTGYATCHLRPDAVGEIGLVGVAAWARGHGVGKALVAAATGWLGSQGCRRARVVTQGRNVAARRLYEGAEFAVVASQRWYHRWRLPAV
jgi:dTDP-4-amino-4,6-dideoxy-D-galactose acyltransferase